MRGRFAFLVLVAAALLPAQAAEVSTPVRLGTHGNATATAAEVPDEGVILTLQLPDGRTQSFPRLGTELIPISGKIGERPLVAVDIDRDGIDEIFVRNLVPPKVGALVGLRWDAATREFAPIQFTDDREQTTPYLIVDLAMPVSIGRDGILAEFQTKRADGRISRYAERYRWNGSQFRHEATN